ncbi:MAG: helix-turn-helix transcriptional regulator [Pseudomonadota bacterium]|nr:helix-turn-helix transcriptional regulator [Pseudomonadota bacterium]
MLNLIPRHTPPLSVLMDDLRIKPREMARVFGISERSIYRWMVKDQAPRVVMLSLFWISRWGRGLIAVEEENAARMYAGMASCLLSERRNGSRLFSMPIAAANSGRWARFQPRLVSGQRK